MNTHAAPNQALTVTDRPREQAGADHPPLNWRLFARMFRYTRPYRLRRGALVAAVSLRAVQVPVLAWMFGTFLKQLLDDPTGGEVAASALIFAGFALFTMLTLYFRQLWALQLAEDAIHDLRRDLFAHLQRMTMSFFDRTKVGWIISRVVSDTEAMKAGIQNVVFASIVGLGQMAIAAALMLWIDPVLFLLIAGITPVLWGLNVYFRKRFSQAYRQMRESFSRVTSTLAESVSGIRVTQGFVREGVNASLFSDLVAEHSEYNYRAQRLQGVFLPLLESTSQIFIAALLVVGGWQVFQHAGTAGAGTAVVEQVGRLVQFFFLATVFFQPISSLGQLYTQALAAMAGAERVFRLLDQAPAWRDPPEAEPIDRVAGRIAFESVRFGYDPEKPVLHAIDFTAEPGQTIALVGPTGSGKSSIINLLTKFYVPQAGRVLVDGRDTRWVSSDSLLAHVGIVLQENFLFTGTVMDNIRIGRPEASDAQVTEVTERLDCRDLLENLPEGLMTRVGETGAGISLGQKQLICFCRAMLADPAILILDEATSAVDTVTEARIQHALEILLGGRTSLVVAHRLSTIRHADTVLVLQDGHLVERGPHTRLLEAGGLYAQLYRQFIRATEA